MVNDLIKDLLQPKSLEALVETKSIKFTDSFFIYHDGTIGHIYINSENIQEDGMYFASVRDSLSILATTNFRDFEVISGGESRDWIFSLPVATHLHDPHSMIYKDGRIIGADVNGKRVLHISDLCNQASSVERYWKLAIEKAGGILEGVLFYINRNEPESAQRLEKIKVRHESLITLDDNAWERLIELDAITNAQYESLLSWRRNKQKWTKEMLKSVEGNEQLKKYLEENNPMRDRAKEVKKSQIDS